MGSGPWDDGDGGEVELHAGLKHERGGEEMISSERTRDAKEERGGEVELTA